ncbi:antitermination protein [Pluralibacter gergoviae]|uniref:Antitermination protein n=1 Tax=Pluralibacter gergoviae TaxID=61647 RepID=A0AAI9DRY4_PLUGE|nr:antitermination protein [Pluralibacter gergoviae]EKV9911270.1 antitermination protein [Pluralibacter gergoviae]EKW7277230.1 antitermination protein [Pluralibacter gergoviae]ELD4298722.1 antitermination protein [Pluralibacter gergoviae]ELD4309502.1 antitermination protein [Pluralibacter gergoviae]
MQLESSLKYFSPQGMLISDSVKGTSPDRLTGTDIMAAIGTTSSRARFGLAAFFGKAGVSKADEQLATQALARYAMETASKNVRKAAGAHFGWCMLVLAQFAFAEYSRSAASAAICKICGGTGLLKSEEDVMAHPGIFRDDGTEVVAPKIRRETMVSKCETCGGKGTISARCRCGGKGEVLDRKATKETGAPVFKTCERCSGHGFSSVPSTAAHKAILRKLPDLHVRTWTRNWKPFLDVLVNKCWHEERRADIAFSATTASEQDIDNF